MDFVLIDVLDNQTFHVTNITTYANVTQSNETLYDEVQPSERAHESVIVPLIFLLILIFGVTGNGAILFVVAKYRELKTVPYVLIVNLAVADLLIILICVPFSATIYALESWIFGQTLCKINEFLQTVVVTVSIFTLSVLSIERYLTINQTNRRDVRKNRRHVTIIVVCSWLLGILIALPDLIAANLVQLPRAAGRSIYVCVPHPFPSNTTYNKTITMLKFLLLFVIPLTIITIFYTLLSKEFFSKEIDCSREDSYTNDHQEKCLADRVAKKGHILQRRLHLAKLVLFLVVIFVICWLPRHVYLIWFHYSDHHYNEFWHIFKITGFCLTFLYSAFNPIVIYLLDSVVNRYIKRHLFCCCYKGQTEELQPLGDDDIELSLVPDIQPTIA